MFEADARAAAVGLGVYLHVPFCATRCDYCAFATWSGQDDLIDRYLDALAAEIETARREGVLQTASTVFVGGGTPSLLGGDRLTRLLRLLEWSRDAEVTIECNPESTTPELLDALLDAGVTRISLGVQSLSPAVLSSLGRTHSNGSALRALELVANAGFRSFNADLIYGAVGETDDSWRATLDGVLASSGCPPHISAYGLIVEPGTPLSKDATRHPDDDTEARRYEIADEILSSAGYAWYELSNWSLPGHECQHNWATWMGGEYLGFGCAAHSHLDGRRFANVFSLTRYLERIEAGRSAMATEERLPPEGRELERLELLIRTRLGVRESCLPDDLVEAGLIERRAGRAVLTRRGRLLANEVALALQPSSQPILT